MGDVMQYHGGREMKQQQRGWSAINKTYAKKKKGKKQGVPHDSMRLVQDGIQVRLQSCCNCIDSCYNCVDSCYNCVDSAQCTVQPVRTLATQQELIHKALQLPKTTRLPSLIHRKCAVRSQGCKHATTRAIGGGPVRTLWDGVCVAVAEDMLPLLNTWVPCAELMSVLSMSMLIHAKP